MTVVEYTSKFEELCQFSKVYQGALEDYEEWEYIKYDGGLQSDILSVVRPMEVQVFSELVNKSRVVEECSRKVVVERGDHREFHKRDQGKSYASRDQNFKRGGYAPQYNQGRGDNRRNDNRRFHGRGSQERAQPYQLMCNKPCRAGFDLCYTCGQPGHFSKSCPHREAQDAGKAQQWGRVFTMTADDTGRSDTLIKGNNEISNKTLISLYDTGASHSFIAFDKVEELRLKLSALIYNLHVHTATSEAVITRLGCQQVSFWIENTQFFHDLIYSSLSGLDLILGLD
ncbi:uncharacterized protein LOC107611380 [Arachis ipaensis]|uniref:uncharacterized protein LOC107611380 n=1 Tax=Arachis ipaensis TaxID=130454 RepID=UPI0007AFB02F|nr:uncharacterized protein LOC107611380 [Arachis ipaensis]XP_025670426.1 uncharacterized protein LOC112770255 [Arachis hypogaea]